MHDHGCDDIFIIVTDMKRAEMDAATEYFKFVCQHTFGQTVKHKHNTEREIHYRRKREIRILSAFAYGFAHVSMRATTYHHHHQMRA
jgi:hypothetical protein